MDGYKKLIDEAKPGQIIPLVKEIEKPSWGSVFSRGSECSPRWYRESREIDDIRFWDEAMGEGFSDWYAWYLKSGIESARGAVVGAKSEPTRLAAKQLALPGFEAEIGITDGLLF